MVPGRDILVRRLSVLPGLACPSDLPRLLEGRDVRTTTKNSIERSSNFPVQAWFLLNPPWALGSFLARALRSSLGPG